MRLGSRGGDYASSTTNVAIATMSAVTIKNLTKSGEGERIARRRRAETASLKLMRLQNRRANTLRQIHELPRPRDRDRGRGRRDPDPRS